MAAKSLPTEKLYQIPGPHKPTEIMFQLKYLLHYGEYDGYGSDDYTLIYRE